MLRQLLRWTVLVTHTRERGLTLRIAQPPAHLGADELAVRAVLQRWDPIGSIRAGGPVDEYDDLILPILDVQATGGTPQTLAADLRQVLQTDYGLTQPMAECLVVAHEIAAASPTQWRT